MNVIKRCKELNSYVNISPYLPFSLESADLINPKKLKDEGWEGDSTLNERAKTIMYVLEKIKPYESVNDQTNTFDDNLLKTLIEINHEYEEELHRKSDDEIEIKSEKNLDKPLEENNSIEKEISDLALSYKKNMYENCLSYVNPVDSDDKSKKKLNNFREQEEIKLPYGSTYSGPTVNS